MVEYIVNEHIMSGINLLSTELNVKGGKCFLKRCNGLKIIISEVLKIYY